MTDTENSQTQMETNMTAIQANRTTTKAPANPHHVGTIITAWAIPFVFIGALWGAGHDPEHAGVSAFAFVAIVAIHLVQRIRRAVWKHRQGSGK
jgi:hypothetical protein